ncbi:hypothetical protein E4U53_001470, partial [Claviceps sorghi]
MDVGGFALITGAASGIGKACARAFVKEGAGGVALVDINEEALRAVRAELDSEVGGAARLATYVLDVTDEEQVQRVVGEAAAWLGRLDYVVNAAGVVGGFGRGAAHATTAEWKQALDVNLDGTFFVLRAAARVMLGQQPRVSSLDGGGSGGGSEAEAGAGAGRRQRGSIINVASVLGRRGRAEAPAYVASKHAVVGLTRSAAAAHARDGLRINAICPGYTDTPLLTSDAVLHDALARTVAATPMGRWARPEEIADGVLFLAGGRSSFVTGTTLTVDGGGGARPGGACS